MKKYFNKEIVMTEDDNKNFESSTNCWICDKIFVEADAKVSNLVMSLENIGMQHTEIAMLTSV